MKNRYMLIVSLDAMVTEDLPYAKTLPNFARIFQNSSQIDKVKTIYPTLTHPIHATLLTGCTAGKHGVICNETFSPGNLILPWYNSLPQIKVPTIFHKWHEAGYTIAACRWPHTEEADDIIDYVIPELVEAHVSGKTNADLPDIYAKLCTPSLMPIINKYIDVLDFNKRPMYEEFQVNCLCDIIKEHKPNIMMTHLCMIDYARHAKGLFGEHIKEAIDTLDVWLGKLLDTLEKTGIYENTDIILLSDHGHLDIRRTICLNAILAEKGWLQVENGALKDWRVYIASATLSAHVYVKNKADEDAVYKLLCEMAEDGIYGIDEVLTAAEADARYGLSGCFSFVIESDGYTSFNDDWKRPFVRPCDPLDYRYGRATHGHMPEKGPQPPFIVSGPSFKKGVHLENGSILDEAPTFLYPFGLTLEDADGKPIMELLNC